MQEKYLAIPSSLLKYFVLEFPHLYLFREGGYIPFRFEQRESLEDNLLFLPELQRHFFISELVKGISETLLKDNARSFRRECRVLHEIFNFLVIQLRDNPHIDVSCQKLSMLMAGISLELGKRDLPVSQLVDYLSKLRQDSYDPFFLHSCLIAFSCQRLLNAMGAEYHIFNETMIYAAYFHDIMLALNFGDSLPDLVQRSIEENEGGQGEKSALMEEERRHIIRQHAKDGASFVKEVLFIPEETVRIIRQHHGMLSGIGFSNQIHGRFSMLVSMFIMMDDFSGRHFREISTLTQSSMSNDILSHLYETYHHKNYQEILALLKKLL